MFDLTVQWLILAIDISVKAMVLAAIAVLSLRVLKLNDSNLRHRTLTGVLIGMLLLPVLSQTLPTLQLPVAVPEHWKIYQRDNISPATASVDNEDAKLNAIESYQASSTSLAIDESFGKTELYPSERNDAWPGLPDIGPEAEFSASSLGPEVTDNIHPTVAETDSDDSEVAAIPPSLTVQDPQPPLWPGILLAIWLTGAGVMALRLLAGVAYSFRLVWSSSAITSSDLAELGVDFHWLKNERLAMTCECPLICVPVALGVIRPRILLPSAWNAWSAEKLQAVIAHEQTHIQRADGAVIFLAELNRCLYWFHPVAWWLRSQLGQLAETACDDAAIDCTGDRASYARHLLEVASAVSGRRSRLISVGISMARPSNVETRINAILDFTRPLSKRLTWTTTLLLFAALVPLITLAAAVQPSTETTLQPSVEQVASNDDTSVVDKFLTDSGQNNVPVRETSSEVGTSASVLQSNVPPADQDSAIEPAHQTFTFAGTVVDEDGQPITDAEISWVAASIEQDKDGLRETVVSHSDIDGHFQFTRDSNQPDNVDRSDPSLLHSKLVAKKAGYGFGLTIAPYCETSGALTDRLDEERSTLSSGIRQWLEKNDGPITNVLTLIPDDVPIHGEVLNTDGRPIAGALVQAIEIWESPDASLDAFEHASRLSGVHETAATNELRALATGIAKSGKRVQYVSPVTSDADGRFTLRGLGRERVTDLLITRDGIESTIVQVRSRSGEKIELNPDSATYRRDASIYPAEFTCIVGPSVPVVGRVLDSKTGAPLANMSVEAERFKPSEDKTVFLMMYGIRDTTNSEGEYRLEGLPLGNSEIEVQSPAGVPYLPGKVNVTTVIDSNSAKCEIEVAKGVIARGLISDERTGQPLAGQLTYFSLSRNANLDTAMSFRGSGATPHWIDETGRYEIPVLPGEGILAFMASNADDFVRGSGAEKIDAPSASGSNDSFTLFYTEPYLCAPVNFNFLAPLDVSLNDESVTIDLTLSSGFRVRGRVLTSQGESLNNFCIYGTQDYGLWSWPPISSEEFEISGYLPHEPRRLLFYHPATNLVGEHVLRGRPPEMLNITLAQGATITGRVIDADGIALPGVEIGSSHHDSHSGGTQTFEEQLEYGPLMVRSENGQVRTDAEGRFEFHGIIPGLKYAASVSRGNRHLGSIFHDVTAEPGETKDLGDVQPIPITHETASTSQAPNAGKTPNGDSSSVKSSATPTPQSYSGRVETPEGEPIAGAKIWLASSHGFNSEVNRENQAGLLRELGTADEQGRFKVVLDPVTTQEIRRRIQFSQSPLFAEAQLVVTAPGRGLDWMPLEVFEDDPAPGKIRDALQTRIDKALGDGRFVGRTLKLRAESQPIQGRLVDLEGHPLPKVTVRVESLYQPDIPRLLKALEKSWKREVNEALSTTRFGVWGIARSDLQRLIPPVTTDENGEFELRGIGDDQLATLIFNSDRVEARPVYVLGREMETVSLPNDDSRPAGAKDVFMGRDFTYAVGPSVPVEGVVTDYDTGDPVVGVLVHVDRLFKEGSVNQEQLLLDTHHMRAVTDRQGRFHITGMPPGEGHVLEVAPPMSEPYLMMTQDVSPSLEDGDAKRIEIQVKRGVWIEGRLTDKESGEPRFATVDYMPLKKNPHALIKLGPDSGWLQQRYATDSDGRYRTLGLPGPGVLLVKSNIPGYPLAAGVETIDGYDAPGGVIPTTFFPLRVSEWHLLKQIDPAADVISFTCDLVLDAGLSIPGRVVGPDGIRISDFYVLGQTEREAFWGPRNADGTRTTTDRISVNGYDGIGPRQLFFKNQDETLVGQYRLEGNAPEEIVVTLGPSVRVTGRLIENKTDLPAARYFLSCEECLLPNEKYPPVKFMIHWCHTDDEGRFEIKGLMAGLKYKMYALNESDGKRVGNRFTIELTAAKPGDVIELGDVTGPNGGVE